MLGFLQDKYNTLDKLWLWDREAEDGDMNKIFRWWESIGYWTCSDFYSYYDTTYTYVQVKANGE